MSDVTRILSAIEEGESNAAEQLLPLVYKALRRLAAQKLAQEKRGHFFVAAAEAMRRILIDNARRRRSRRRGGEAKRLPLESLEAAVPASDDQLLAVNEALERLQSFDPAKAEMVKLRYFGGLTIPEAAQALGIAVTTANRYWAYARAWLHEELAAGGEAPSP